MHWSLLDILFQIRKETEKFDPKINIWKRMPYFKRFNQLNYIYVKPSWEYHLYWLNIHIVDYELLEIIWRVIVYYIEWFQIVLGSTSITVYRTKIFLLSYTNLAVEDLASGARKHRLLASDAEEIVLATRFNVGEETIHNTLSSTVFWNTIQFLVIVITWTCIGIWTDTLLSIENVVIPAR